MAFSAKLAELFVEFVAKGQNDVKKAFDELREKLEGAQVAADILGGAIQSRLNNAVNVLQRSMAQQLVPAIEAAIASTIKQIAAVRGISEAHARHLVLVEEASAKQAKLIEEATRRVQAYGRTATDALGRLATGAWQTLNHTIGNFVRQGVGASAIGQVLSFHMEALSRTIAGLFGPEIRKLVDLVRNLTRWINQLSDAQRDSLSRWIQGAAVFALVGVLLPRLYATFILVVTAVKAVSGSFLGLAVSMAGLLPLLGLAIAAFAGMMAGSESGRASLAPLGQAFASLATAVGKLLTALAPIAEVIAKAMTPAVEALAGAISWLSGLINENTLKWGAAIGAFVLFLVYVPRIVAGFTAIIVKVWALVTALIAQNAVASSGASLLRDLALVALAVGAGAAAYNATDKALAGEKQAGGKAKPHRGPEAPRVTGFEQLEAAWDRVALASMKATAGGVGKTVEEQQLDELRRIDQNLGRVEQAVREKGPSIKER